MSWNSNKTQYILIIHFHVVAMVNHVTLRLPVILLLSPQIYTVMHTMTPVIYVVSLLLHIL